MGTTEDGGEPAWFHKLSHLPRILNQGRGGGDADQFVRLALGLRFIEIGGHWDILDSGIIDHDIVSRVSQDGGQVTQTEGDMFS